MRTAAAIGFLAFLLAQRGAAEVVSAKEDFSLLPVLFVHGSGLSSATWTVMIEALAARGYPRAYLHAVDLSPNNGSNVRAAEQQLRPAALRLLETARASALRAGHRAPPAHLAVVGHSMGAFSGRWLAARILPEKVRLFVSIAGANFGTNALCRLSGEGNREMCPAFAQDRRTNPAQVELNGSAAEPRDPTPFGLGPDPSDGPSVPPDRRAIAYYTVRFDGDPWIKPNRSAELPGAGGLVLPPAGAGLSETAPGNFLLSPASGHAPPTARPGVIGRVKRLLLGSPWADHDSLPADPRIIDWVEMLLRASRDAAWPRPGGK